MITFYFDEIFSNCITCISILSKQLSGKDGLDGDICIGWIVHKFKEQKFRQVKCIWRDYNIIKKVGCNVMELNVKKVKDNGGKENEWNITVLYTLWI